MQCHLNGSKTGFENMHYINLVTGIAKRILPIAKYYYILCG
jgi:hypothetical protein